MTERRRKKLATKRQRRARRGRTGHPQPETKVHGFEEAGLPIGGLVAAPVGRRVSLFKNGRSQAVRIPREFELPGKEAIMRKEGERLIIEPAPKRSLIEFLDSLEPIDEEFPPIEDMPPEPVDL
jgi:antitoxin VapB